MPYSPETKLTKEMELRVARREALTAARQLGYSEDTIDEIKRAKTPDRISVVMCTARNNMKD
jgi:hypothetical protein